MHWPHSCIKIRSYKQNCWKLENLHTHMSKSATNRKKLKNQTFLYTSVEKNIEKILTIHYNWKWQIGSRRGFILIVGLNLLRNLWLTPQHFIFLKIQKIFIPKHRLVHEKARLYSLEFFPTSKGLIMDTLATLTHV